MIKKISGETWKQLEFAGWKQLRKKYALSSNGRVCSFSEHINNDGKLLNGSLTSGYKTLNLHRSANNGTLYIHREVARIFLKKMSTKHKYVIHINYNKSDNTVKNLKWATDEEMINHQQKSPAKVAYKKTQAEKNSGLKLSIADVKSIKKTLMNKDRQFTIKFLAGKYGVSEMTLYRIKSGENWAKIK